MRSRSLCLTGCLVGIALLCSPVTPARAGQESATAGIEMSPRSGVLYREVPRPVNWRVEAELTTAWPEAGAIVPMKRIRVTFPVEMSFNPDPRMPVCPDSKVGPPPVNMSVSPEAIIARCPNSVLGNGTADLYLGRGNSPEGPTIDDGVLIIFNGGRTRDGTPRLKVYGFSESLATTGTYLEGKLRRNVLVVGIPYLTADSSVGRFDLNIPGRDSPFPNRRGLDPRFVRAMCANGSWQGSASFTLGARDDSGNAIGYDTVVDAPPVTKPCTGARGSPRLRIARTARRSFAPGLGRSVFSVVVRNAGTATARGFRLRASGRRLAGSARVASVPPGTARRVRIVVGQVGRTGNRRKPPKPGFRLQRPAG